LVAWREEVARVKRAAFRDEPYWGRPVPGFGDPEAWLLVVGLAPAAHGANRTGRMFTGDRSGDWLYRALHRAGLASQPSSISREDGLRLRGVYITAAVRCAPPGNRPTTSERENCREFLEAELDLLENLRVVVALGGFGYGQALRVLADRGFKLPTPRPGFAHGREFPIGPRLHVQASYHPSQQNTFTKRLTEPMFDRIWARALELRGEPVG
jgi:uracil-DNA glycosylase family 4